jgi:hypothetical protein
MSNKESPSTKARRDGYASLFKLRRILIPLFLGYRKHLSRFANQDDCWLDDEFDKVGWRDYMVRHLPVDKRGGPSVQPSKRRRSKKADRNSTVR